MTSTPALPDEVALTWSSEELAAVLGISRDSVFRAVKHGTLPIAPLRIGRLIRHPARPWRELVATGVPLTGTG